MEGADDYAEAGLDGFPVSKVPVDLVAERITHLELKKTTIIATGDYLTAQRYQHCIFD
jgi:hypothetical protein